MELKEILEDYINRFEGKICTITTNYRKYDEIRISFRRTDIPHLLGLHKQYRENSTNIVAMISAGDITIMKLHREVVTRVELYRYVVSVFYEKLGAECVFDKDIKPNSMNLTLAILTPNGRKTVVIGLRLGKDDYYHLVTIHEANTKKYNGLRKSKIKSIDMK